MQDHSCIFQHFGFVSFIVKIISSLKGNKVFCSMESLDILLHHLFYYVKNAVHFWTSDKFLKTSPILSNFISNKALRHPKLFTGFFMN